MSDKNPEMTVGEAPRSETHADVFRRLGSAAIDAPGEWVSIPAPSDMKPTSIHGSMSSALAKMMFEIRSRNGRIYIRYEGV